MKIKPRLIALSLAASVALTPSTSQALLYASEPTQIIHMGLHQINWALDAVDRITQLYNLANQLAQQKSISGVLGVTADLLNLPAMIENFAVNAIGIPLSVIDDIAGLGDHAMYTYDHIRDTFSNKPKHTRFGPGGNFLSPQDMQERIGGLRSQMASQYLDGSQRRSDHYKQWKQDQAHQRQTIVSANGNAIKLQAAQAQNQVTANDFAARTLEVQEQAQEQAAMSVLDNQAREMRQKEIHKAAAAHQTMRTQSVISQWGN